MGSSARDHLTSATQRLADAGIGSPRVDAELLLAHALGVSRAQLLTVDDLVSAQSEQFDDLIAMRCKGIPLQHLTGRAPFRHLDLAVGPGVFIPRPETELILELADQPLSAAGTVVDLCAGSGAIALAVAQECQPARVIAVERSERALTWLRRNAADRIAAGDRGIEIVAGDINDPSLLDADSGTVDVVLSNPPYVPEALRSGLSREVSHDPDEAVFAGPDGLLVMPALIALAGTLLRPGGFLAIEHDDGHAAPLIDLMRRTGRFGDIADHADLTGRPRFVTALRLS